MSPLPAQVGAAIGGRSWDLAAQIERAAGVGGVIFATGTANSGLSLFIQDDRLFFDYNCFGEHHIVASSRRVPDGASKVGVQFRRGPGKGGEATLVIDAESCGSLALPFVMRIISSIGPSVGFDHGSPVSERYVDAFPFGGRIERVDIALVTTRGGEAGNAAAEERVTMARQ
jgi:arylsulfatase